MGSGKTTYVLDSINAQYVTDRGRAFATGEDKAAKFLVVVPLLSEVDRFTSKCPNLMFKNPQPFHGRKLYHLEKLIEDGENIVTTHALFSMLNRSIYEKLKGQGYRLIIDEVLECVEMFTDLSKKDQELLFTNEMVYVDDKTRRLCWNYECHPEYEGKFTDIKKLCDTGSLVSIKDKMLLWEFPSEFLTCFDEVTVCTYLFKGSPFYAYLQAEGFDIEFKTIRHGQVHDWDDGIGDAEVKAQLRSLIRIYEGPMNALGAETGKSNPLSSSWYSKTTEKDLKRLRSSTETFFRRVAETPSYFNGWTAFSKAKTSLKGAGYAKGWIPNNAKGTNDYAHKQSMAYLCNWFYQPVIKGYFRERGITIDEEAYALSSMIQWIWRSQIRQDKPITVFVPSERMRRLLKEWLSLTVAKADLKIAA